MVKSCNHLSFENLESFKQWYESNEFRPFSLDKVEAECSSLAFYLHSLVYTKGITINYPIDVTKSESPDFKIQFGQHLVVGLEHTTVTSEKYQQFRSENLRNPKQEVVFLDQFKIGGAPQKEYNQGWVGKEAEAEWVLLALPRIQDKLEKLNKNHFSKYAANELLLNTVSYLPNLDMELAIKLLGIKLNETLLKIELPYSFDSISIIYGSCTYPKALVRNSE